MSDFLGVAPLLLTTAAWFGTGFALARAILRQNQWIVLLPTSLGMGLIVQMFLLNILLYALSAEVSFWASLLIMGLIMIGVARWQRDLEPITLGVPRTHAYWLIGGVLLLWLAIIIGLIRHTYFDLYFHYSIAGLVANGGLPIRYPYNPDYCSVYHYGSDMLIGVLFRVSGLNMVRAAEWVIAWSSLSILGMVVNIGYRISWRKPVVVALLGLGLFAFGGGATWLTKPFQNEDVVEITQDMPVFDYLKIRPELRERPPARAGTPFTDEYFNYPYFVHLYNVLFNPPLICVLLLMMVLLNSSLAERANWATWVLMGIVTATAALSAETMLSIPLGLVGFYMLYQLWINRQNAHAIVMNTAVFAIPVMLLVIFQGGVVTDTLFCAESELTAPGEPTSALSLFHAPGYYSFLDHPNSVRINLIEPDNWARWVSEWGLLFFLLPFVIYHFWRRNPQPLARIFLLTAVLTIAGTLTAEYTDGFELGRIIYVPLYFAGIFAADWLVWLFSRLWWRPVAALLFIAVCLSGLMAMREIVYSKEPQISFPQSELDIELQQKWFGKLGSRDAIIFDTQQVSFTSIYIPALFGNYTLAVPSRSNRHEVLASIAWLSQYPAPELLQYKGIEYLYIKEQWWNSAAPQVRELISTRFERVFWEEENGVLRGMVRVPDADPAPAWFDLIDAAPLRETFSQENVYLVYQDWAVPAGEQVFYPRDTVTVPMNEILPDLILPENVDPALIEKWNTTALPGYLAQMDTESVLINPWQWGLYFNNEIRNQITNPAYFEEIKRWQVGRERFYVLYRPISDATLETLGMSSAVYTDYQAYETAIPDEAGVYYPDIRPNFERQQALLGGYLEALETEARGEFFNIAAYMEQARLNEDFAAEQQSALTQWRQTLMPGYLKDAGVNYLVITSLWWGFNLNEEQFNQLMNPAHYRLVQRSDFDAWDQSFRYGYILLEVVGEER